MPSPSLGPPLLSASWSPPLSCGMPLLVVGGGGGVVVGGGGGVVVGGGVVGGGVVAGGGGGGDVGAEIWSPAGREGEPWPPKAFTPSPLVSPGF